MARPSRNLDRALIAAGQALYPSTGCAGLTIRQVADAAGVNIGMFHYHFKTREAFLRAVLEANYEDMFSRLPVVTEQLARDFSHTDLLRHALKALGHWSREHRGFIARLLADCMAHDPVARSFFAANFPRHLERVGQIIAAAQQAGALRAMPLPQAMAFCAGAISLPLIAVGTVVDSGMLPAPRKRSLEAAVLSAAAVDERIELVLHALGTPLPATRKAAPKASKKKKGTS
ncbi:hypothetical protein DSM104443_00051 [Usitatibacter rugosus]|uniref:HTH tetR-type domain-containing protein n=1 Tax=Usitatibacter rugosus TaxID=2732067 RepID=A0A6M4GPM1_9PROT|nr:TetR/AcrR family transcriptional regulator [Usitatibacter rugosus]QJR09016.1 hypothetical protein DSM104443_00051 [Usitatibacter rugosus]